MVEDKMNEAYDHDLQKPSVFPVDQYGLPGVYERDGSFGGGDSAAIYGKIVSLDPWFDGINWQLLNGVFYSFSCNQPVRHPNTRCNRFSRDQLVPMYCATLRMQDTILGFAIGKLILKAHKKNWYLRAWNKEANGDEIKPHPGGADWTLFQVWALILRIKKPKWSRAVLWFLDLENLIGSLIWIFKTKTQNLEQIRKDRITSNHMLVAIMCVNFQPTWVSRLSYKLTPFTALITRWDAHCRSVKEYNTADLFREAIQ
jgi:hypothetical protein